MASAETVRARLLLSVGTDPSTGSLLVSLDLLPHHRNFQGLSDYPREGAGSVTLPSSIQFHTTNLQQVKCILALLPFIFFCQ